MLASWLCFLVAFGASLKVSYDPDEMDDLRKLRK